MCRLPGFAKSSHDDLSRQFISTSLSFSKLHLSTILRFGRFPSRNKSLGTESTEEEREYLKEKQQELEERGWWFDGGEGKKDARVHKQEKKEGRVYAVLP